MIKSKIKSFSRRSLSTVLALLMMFSTMMVGTITANAWNYSDSWKIYGSFPSDHWSSGPDASKTDNKVYYVYYPKRSETDKVFFRFRSDTSNQEVGPDASGNCDATVNHNWIHNSTNGAYYVPISGTASDGNQNKWHRVVIGYDTSSGYIWGADTTMTDLSVSLTSSLGNSFAKNQKTTLTATATGDFSTSYLDGGDGGRNIEYTYQISSDNWATCTETKHSSKTSKTDTLDWTPTTAGTYKLKVFVNDKGLSSDNAKTTDRYAVCSDVTITVKETYAVNYYKGSVPTSGGNTGGTISGSVPSAQTKVQGTNLTLATNCFTSTGFVQNGWATSDRGAQAYTSEGIYSTNAALNLYPHWDLATYTITYAPGAHGTGTVASTGKTHFTNATLSSSTFTYDGSDKHQDGWSTTDGGAKVYELGGTYSTEANVTLYPHWTINIYTVTLSESPASGGTLEVDDAAYAGGVTHGSHTFKLTAPSGYQISTISGLGTWSIDSGKSFATLGSTSVTANSTITVVYSTAPALTLSYTGASGAATASSGSVTTSTNYNVKLELTNQKKYASGTAITATVSKNGGAATNLSFSPATTANSDSAITLKAAGTLVAGTYVYTVTIGGVSSSITVVVNQRRTLTVSSVSHTTVSGTYTDEFGRASQSISAAGTYYCVDSGAYDVTYTADTHYCFSASDNTATTKNYASSITADATLTPTVYEQKYAVTVAAQTQGTKALGTVTPAGGTVSPSYFSGASITATPKTGYEFVNWTRSSNSITFGNANSATTTVTASAGATATANFRQTRLYLDVSEANSYWKNSSYHHKAYFFQNSSAYTTGTNSGFLDMEPVEGVDDIYYVDLPGSFNTLTSNYGFKFVVKKDNNNNDWSGDYDQCGDQTFSDKKNRYKVVDGGSWEFDDDAYFPPVTYTVNIASGVGGSVVFKSSTTIGAGTNQNVKIGDVSLSLVATPATGYTFGGWVTTGEVALGSSTSTASNTVTADNTGTITASFTPVSHNITKTESNATISITGGATSAATAQTVSFTVSPAQYYSVGTVRWRMGTGGWTNLTAVNGTYSFTVSADSNSANNIEISATGNEIKHTVTVSAGSNGSVASASESVGAVTTVALPTPTGDYGYKFASWEVTTGSVIVDTTTYTAGTANAVFSTTAATSIKATANAAVRANFTYNNSLNIYITGCFSVYNSDHTSRTYTKNSGDYWNNDATYIRLSGYNAENHYYYLNTNSTIAELSEKLDSSNWQYFRFYDGTNHFYPSSGTNLEETDENTKYTLSSTNSSEHSLWFEETSNTNGPVTICFDATTKEFWFKIPPRHTVSVGTITTSPHAGSSPGHTGAGGTVKVNNGSSASVSEGTNYTITATPASGYQLTALAVNGTSVIGSISAGAVTHAMATDQNNSYVETITATFTAIQYRLTTGSASNVNGGTVAYKKNDSATATSDTDTAMTVEDYFKPVITPNTASGYKLSSAALKDDSNNTIQSLSNTGTALAPSFNNVGMPAKNTKIQATWEAITPQLTGISATTPGVSTVNEHVSVSSYAISGAYAGQSITITPAVDCSGTISYTIGGTDSGKVTNNGSTLTFAVPLDIGHTAGSDASYSFTVQPVNSPTGVDAASGTTQTVTVSVTYSAVQQAYWNLSNQYDIYNDYGITEDDVSADSWLNYEDRMSTVAGLLTGIPAWDSEYNYNNKKSLLVAAYNSLVFNTNTIYVLSKYEHSASSYVNIYVFDNENTNHKPDPIFYTDSSITSLRIDNDDDTYNRHYHMTYEGQTVDGKYLYSFTYRGKIEFIIYRRSGSTTLLENNKKLTGDVDMRESAYGEYYIDVKDLDVTSSPSVTGAASFTDFNVAVTGADASLNLDLINQCKEGDTGYTVAQIQSKLGITYSGSLATTSSQTINQDYTITRPDNTTVHADNTHNWVPTLPGEYTFTFTASLGTDNREGAGAIFRRAKDQTDSGATLKLYVAYDEIEFFADMNGNIGTPTIHFTYTDTKGTESVEDDEDADLPLEFDMVTGSESIYSRIISLSTLKDKYGLDLITSGSLTITKISVDAVDIPSSSFTIDTTAARKGTLWLKADSTNMKTFNKISYGSATKTFKAVLKNGAATTAYNSTFADVRGTGIINDQLNGDSYEYTAFYAAKDTDYIFSYNLKARAETDISYSSTHYYFDHWEKNGVEVTDEASGTDININTAPVYSAGNITYVAVYKPTSTQKRVEITYHFMDYDTSDGDYAYDSTKPLVDETYTKTVKLSDIPLEEGESPFTSISEETNDASIIAGRVAPIINSNYFDYDYDTAEYVKLDATTNKYKVNAYYHDPTDNPEDYLHTYKIVIVKPDSTQVVKTGYYQQALELKASDYGITSGDYHWSVYDGSTERVLVSFDSTDEVTYVSPDKTSFTARFGTNNSYESGIYTVKLSSGTAATATASSITHSYSFTYYDNDTKKAQHNFYIIDALTSSNGTLVGGGVVYATANGVGGAYRQPAARTTLDTTENIQLYISGILNGTYNKEYKAQTINNIGFRYLPYTIGQDVFRYSEAINAYVYTFAGTNTNSSSLDGQTLRVFSYFIYDNNGTKNIVVSSTYAEATRYIS